ncbi:hypothetical protein RSOLAG22IIIB_09290 [Rhizoctonia solani]|uniref:Uncharacterized protein n=1 Tax=Rhizoctonia solani TaxID=456999 RepID=A0A0K6FY17_9AGAM|nr:hypothetical protein RSOLAG22IIIB_09290 [Rhizoctonia solani]
MSSHQGTQNIGSGNDELLGLGKSVFLVVEHNGQKVAIKRQSDYQKTIASIKKSVPELGSSHDDHIILLAFLAEVDDYVRITEEVWVDLLPRFLTIRVQLLNAPKNPGTGETGNDDSSEDEVVRRAEDEYVSDIPSNSIRRRTIVGMRQPIAARPKLKNDEAAEKRRQQQVAGETSAWAAFLYPPLSEPSETETINDDGNETEPLPPSPYLQYLPSFAQSLPIWIIIKEAISSLFFYYFVIRKIPDAFFHSAAAPRGTRLRPLTTPRERNNQGQIEPPVFLIAEYDRRKVTIPRNAGYQGTLASIKKNFAPLKTAANSQIALLAYFAEANYYIVVTEDLWYDLLPRLIVIRVTLVNDRSSVSSDGCTGGYNPLRYERNTRPRYPGGFMADYMRGFPPDGDIKIGKPVIYLFPPAVIVNVRVELALTRFWTFSEIYPPTTVMPSTKDTESLGESIAWTVNAQPDGMLWDQLTEREVTYLFWEARNAKPRLLSSPPTTRPSSPAETPSHSFNPANPTILPNHSALLPFDKVTGYIDDALIALGLHTEARTSFITYWLPDLSKHAFIALRFLSQKEYEKSAPMNVSPAPDVVTRVFMLFRGVDESQIGLWNGTEMHTDATVWRDIVGVDLVKVHDESLFRVVEWGGVEVK